MPAPGSLQRATLIRKGRATSGVESGGQSVFLPCDPGTTPSAGPSDGGSKNLPGACALPKSLPASRSRRVRHDPPRPDASLASSETPTQNLEAVLALNQRFLLAFLRPKIRPDPRAKPPELSDTNYSRTRAPMDFRAVPAPPPRPPNSGLQPGAPSRRSLPSARNRPRRPRPPIPILY
jgi:hypothetical protein